MQFFFIIGLALLISGCATSTRGTDALVKNHAGLSDSARLEVPFIKQKKNHCGPAAMAMVMKHLKKDVSLNDLNEQMYTTGLEGTFQSEVISVVRRNGMIAIPVQNMHSLTKELASGNPVIVFQNLGLSSFPTWHYAVAVGYKLKGPDIILHTGPDKYKKDDMRYFERNWKLGGYWGLLVLRPDQLSASANDVTHVGAAAALESIGKLNEARTAYETILSKWPQSLLALIGMGNITYTEKDYRASVKFLERAVQYHPENAMAWNNLATAQGAAGMKKETILSSEKALTLADKKNRPIIQKGLKNIRR